MRWKLNQKAKKEPKFRFYALHDRVFRMDVLEAAWKHVGKQGKAAGIDGVRAEDILAEENGVGKFLAALGFTTNISRNWDFRTYDEMLAGEPDAGNPQVRFDEGEQRAWRKPPVALYSTGSTSAQGGNGILEISFSLSVADHSAPRLARRSSSS